MFCTSSLQYKLHNIGSHHSTLKVHHQASKLQTRTECLLYISPAFNINNYNPTDRQLYPTLSFVVPRDFETVTTLPLSTTFFVSLPSCLFVSPASDDPTLRQLYPFLSPVVPSDLDVVTMLPLSVVFLVSSPLACLFMSGVRA